MSKLTGLMFTIFCALFVLSCGSKNQTKLLETTKSSSHAGNPEGPKFLTLPVENADIANGWLYGDSSLHSAVDYSGSLGENIYASCNGVAIRSYSSTDSGFGYYANYVLERCNDQDYNAKNYMIVYAHLESVSEFIESRDDSDRFLTDYENWTPIIKGEVIGQMGSAGTSWIHLHFELFSGDYSQKANNRLDPYDIYGTETKYSSCGSNYVWEKCPPALEDKATWHPEGFLLKTADSPKVYLRTEGNQIQWIYDEDVFNSYHYDWNKIILVTNFELSCYNRGRDITDYPEIIAFRTDFSDEAWIKSDVDNNTCIRQKAETDNILLSWGFNPDSLLSGSEADSYYWDCEEGQSLKFRPGSLINGTESLAAGYDTSAVFVMEQSFMRPIFNGQVYESLGFDWDWALEVSFLDFTMGRAPITDVIDSYDLLLCGSAGIAAIAIEPDCTEGARETCYDGPDGTNGIGNCQSGISECVFGSWSECHDEVTPEEEQDDGLDNDCDGDIDEDFQIPHLPNPESEPECYSNSDCLTGYICQYGQCEYEENEPDVTFNPECRSDSECDYGEICENEECISGCNTDYDCENGYICASGQCEMEEVDITPEPECIVDSDCDLGNICIREVCDAGCNSDNDCPDEYFCVDEEGVCAEIDDPVIQNPPNNGGGENNILCNGDFEDGSFCWELEDHNNSGELEIDCAASVSGSCSAKVTNEEAGIYYQLQLKQKFQITEGQSYRLTFSAKAENNNRSVVVEAVQNHSPWDESSFVNTVFLNTEWKNFSFEFNGTASDSDFKLAFHLADYSDTVWLDNVILSEI